jgi:hypothetical protein
MLFSFDLLDDLNFWLRDTRLQPPGGLPMDYKLARISQTPTGVDDRAAPGSPHPTNDMRMLSKDRLYWKKN